MRREPVLKGPGWATADPILVPRPDVAIVHGDSLAREDIGWRWLVAKFDVLALLPSRLQPLRRPAHSIIILDVHVRLGWAETEKILASFLPPWLTAFMRVRP